jgi:hypothetical protein
MNKFWEHSQGRKKWRDIVLLKFYTPGTCECKHLYILVHIVPKQFERELFWTQQVHILFGIPTYWISIYNQPKPVIDSTTYATGSVVGFHTVEDSRSNK